MTTATIGATPTNARIRLVRGRTSVSVASSNRCTAGASTSAANGLVNTSASPTAENASEVVQAAPGAVGLGSEPARRITDERPRIQASVAVNAVATSAQTDCTSSVIDDGSSGAAGASSAKPTSTTNSAIAKASTNG